jgi:hypothetical protein
LAAVPNPFTGTVVALAVGCVPVVPPPQATRSNVMILKSIERTRKSGDLEEDIERNMYIPHFYIVLHTSVTGYIIPV